MNSKKPFVTVSLGSSRFCYWMPLAALMFSGSTWGMDCPGSTGHDMPISCTTPPPACSYAVTSGTTITPPEEISVTGASGDVYWELSPAFNCSPGSSSTSCLGMAVTLPAGAPDSPVPQGQKVTIGGTAQSGLGESQFTLTVTSSDGSSTCSRTYNPRVTSSGGGWGDPHITTVDGIHYDFQSAGEFVALRGNGMEIQTRQTAIATTASASANPYTGLSSCVAIYTGVAAKVGKHRVSYLQSSKDPKILELRIDGVVTSLGPSGINLVSTAKPVIGRIDDANKTLNPVDAKPDASTIRRQQPANTTLGKIRQRLPAIPMTSQIGGWINKSSDGTGIEIRYVDGTRVVVTPAWWQSQQKWYMNVDVYDTTASQGVMGSIANDSWLPALADGSSVGPKPADTHARYKALYETFANSWRVTKKTSLFDYVPGTSTETFTLADWPRDNPASCAIGNKTTVMAIRPIAKTEATKACTGITDENEKANCIFDVQATGHTGFAQTYQLKQKFYPRTPAIRLATLKDSRRPNEQAKVVATVGRLPSAGTPAGKVQFFVDGKEFGDPVTLDRSGKATLPKSMLAPGVHRVEAQYVGSGFGGQAAVTSRSASITHKVIAAPLIREMR